jgi:hypothetical protein
MIKNGSGLSERRKMVIENTNNRIYDVNHGYFKTNNLLPSVASNSRKDELCFPNLFQE